MLNLLKKIRHRHLFFLRPIWVFLGSIYRFINFKLKLNIISETKIGQYGPFKVDGFFVFSDLENWGESNNNDFKPLIESCVDKKSIIDIGAHVGWVSMPLSKMVNKNTHIHAIEPGKSNRYYLRKHLEINNIKNVTIHNHLLGKECSNEVKFYEKDFPSGCNSVIQIEGKGDFNTSKLEQLSLDVFCARLNVMPDLIKIDVEGMEFDVLQGGMNIIKKCKPIIFLSYHQRYLRQIGVTEENFLKFVRSLGYFSNIKLNKTSNTEIILKPKL